MANAWDRREGESEKAYAAFLKYRDMGPSRSVEGLHKHHTNTTPKPRTLRGWSSNYQWVSRCRAWDNHVQSGRDDVIKTDAQEWERRRLQSLELNWTSAQKIRERIEQMLAWPLEREEKSGPGGVTITEPARWTYANIATLAAAVADIEDKTLRSVDMAARLEAIEEALKSSGR